MTALFSGRRWFSAIGEILTFFRRMSRSLKEAPNSPTHYEETLPPPIQTSKRAKFNFAILIYFDRFTYKRPYAGRIYNYFGINC